MEPLLRFLAIALVEREPTDQTLDEAALALVNLEIRPGLLGPLTRHGAHSAVMSLARDRIAYTVGSESHPGDPFGRSKVVIEASGDARLEQHTRSGSTAWTGRVTAAALDELWKALAAAEFPAMPKHHVPPGAAIRALTIGTPPATSSVYIAWHASGTMPGYRDAFWILDSVIRQLSEDTVKAVAPYGSQIVEAIARAAGPVAVSPGTVFALGFLPARRLAHAARRDLIARNASTSDPALEHAIELSRKALQIADSMVAETDARFAKVASAAGITVPPMPTADGLDTWASTLADRMKPQLSNPVLQASWHAGEAGRRVATAAELVAQIAYLRCAAPSNSSLSGQATALVQDLKASAAALTAQLQATGLPLAISHAHNTESLITLTSNLETTVAEGYRQLNELVEEVYRSLDSRIRHLDTPPPPKPSSGATAEEDALFARIVADPRDYPLRRELAALAAKRNDPRAQLIFLQASPAGPAEARKAFDLVRAHPEWSSRLTELGATNIKFAGGFPAEVTIDAAALLKSWTELRAAAPLTRLHVREANGRVGEIVRSAHLATIEALDLDRQGVVDDDVITLASNPAATRLRQLDLRFNLLTERGIDAIAASAVLSGLQVVNLEPNPADPVDRQEYVDETNFHFVPTDAGKALEAKYGPLRWLRRG